MCVWRRDEGRSQHRGAASPTSRRSAPFEWSSCPLAGNWTLSRFHPCALESDPDERAHDYVPDFDFPVDPG